ncbi:uncharacterized protein LOC141549902 isoform X3 [Sminthopsis crassicaudata]|uniref:uncharacterized protein LOC141549902 isoform X3 n=1 Tax=Sminthopsis crassicaudata TaxID=9301 RepID=UPI003D6859A2
MAFLMAGSLQVAVEKAEARNCLERKGKYDMSGARVALTLCVLEGQTGENRAVAALEAIYQALGFENYLRRVIKTQSFQEELAHFRELLDAHGSPISCALVVLMAHRGRPGWLLGPDGKEIQEKVLVGELNSCQALWGKAKVFLLLGSNNSLESSTFLPILTDLCRQSPPWHLLEVLTQVIGKVTQEMPTIGHKCPVFQSSLRGALYLGRERSQDLEDFQKELAQFWEHLDACGTTVSCALIVLMAHGEAQGQLLGADGQMVKVEEMVRELSACQVLQGKAKVFLLQGCRGGNRDPGTRPRALPWLGRWFQHWLQRPSTLPSQADILQIYADMQDVSSRECFPRNSDQVDILRVYSAAEGYVAYRDENGSTFIQTLVEVIIADPDCDLLELLTEMTLFITRSLELASIILLLERVSSNRIDQHIILLLLCAMISWFCSLHSASVHVSLSKTL